jgi:hypothetical protein
MPWNGESQDKRTDGVCNEISRTRQWWEIYMSIRRPTHSSSNTKMFCSHRSSKTVRSGMCKAVNIFSLQEAVAGVSGEESLVTLKENSNKKAIWNKE